MERKKIMLENVDLYSSIHKGQRSRFFKIAMTAGTTDYNDLKALEKLHGELVAFKQEMYLHASLEEKFIHPVLSNRVPGGARRLEDDHQVMHQKFDDLLSHFEGIIDRSVDFEKRHELALEFYLGWNRFIAFYFSHIDYEEESIQPSLWKLCTKEELANQFKLILADQTPKELMENLEMMFPAMNLSERTLILNMGRASMPPEAFQAALKIAERSLNPDDWLALKSKLGI